MPAFGNLILNDGLATPVAHTFAPQSIVGRVAVYNDRVSGIQAGFGRLEVEIKPPQQGVSNTKVIAKLAIPKVVTYNDTSGKPVTRVDYTPLCEIRFVMPTQQTLAERKDLLAYAKNLLSHADFVKLIHDLEAIY